MRGGWGARLGSLTSIETCRERGTVAVPNLKGGKLGEDVRENDWESAACLYCFQLVRNHRERAWADAGGVGNDAVDGERGRAQSGILGIGSRQSTQVGSKYEPGLGRGISSEGLGKLELPSRRYY